MHLAIGSSSIFCSCYNNFIIILIENVLKKNLPFLSKKKFVFNFVLLEQLLNAELKRLYEKTCKLLCRMQTDNEDT